MYAFPRALSQELVLHLGQDCCKNSRTLNNPNEVVKELQLIPFSNALYAEFKAATVTMNVALKITTGNDTRHRTFAR